LLVSVPDPGVLWAEEEKHQDLLQNVLNAEKNYAKADVLIAKRGHQELLDFICLIVEYTDYEKKEKV